MVYENLSTVCELIDKLSADLKDKIKACGDYNDAAAIKWRYIEDFVRRNDDESFKPGELCKTQLEIIIRFDADERPDICLGSTELLGKERKLNKDYRF